jgi:hypothetical protein
MNSFLTYFLWVGCGPSADAAPPAVLFTVASHRPDGASQRHSAPLSATKSWKKRMALATVLANAAMQASQNHPVRCVTWYQINRFMLLQIACD